MPGPGAETESRDSRDGGCLSFSWRFFSFSSTRENVKSSNISSAKAALREYSHPHPTSWPSGQFKVPVSAYDDGVDLACFSAFSQGNHLSPLKKQHLDIGERISGWSSAAFSACHLPSVAVQLSPYPDRIFNFQAQIASESHWLVFGDDDLNHVLFLLLL